MTTNKPPDLAAIRALCGKLEDGSWDANVVVTINRLAASVPALLDEIDELRSVIDELRSVIENYHDREIHAVAKARGLLG